MSVCIKKMSWGAYMIHMSKQWTYVVKHIEPIEAGSLCIGWFYCELKAGSFF